MKNITNYLLILFLSFFIVYCCKKGETQRIEITQRHDNGEKKEVHKFIKRGELEELIEKYAYNKFSQLIMVENLVEETIKKIQYHKTGKKKRKFIFKQGKKHGRWMEWFSKGWIKREQIYHEGKLTRDSSYKRNIIKNLLYKEGKLYIIREYTNGIISIEKEYRDGKVIKAKYYYPDGKISDEREYKDGLIHGRVVYWDRNGNIRSKSLYEKGILVSEKKLE